MDTLYLNSEDQALLGLLLQLVDEKEYSLAARVHEEEEWEERRLASRLNRVAEARDEEDDTWKPPRRARSYPSSGSPRATGYRSVVYSNSIDTFPQCLIGKWPALSAAQFRITRPPG